MIYSIDKETIDFICEKGLTINQFALCLLIYHKDIAGILKYTNEVGYLGENIVINNGKKMTEIEDLLARGFLLNQGLDRKNEYALDNFIVTEKFTKSFLLWIEDAAQELWYAYPKFLLIGGEEKPTKVCDYDEFELKYLKIINNSYKKHQEILAKLKAFTSAHKYAIMNLMNFIGSRHWEDMPDAQQQQPKSRIY